MFMVGAQTEPPRSAHAHQMTIFCNLDRVVHLDAEIANGALDLRVSK
jgi:hypothetical protein